MDRNYTNGNTIDRILRRINEQDYLTWQLIKARRKDKY